MDIENLYGTVIKKIRAFTNSFSRDDSVGKDFVDSHLQSISNRMDFLMREEIDSKDKEKELINELNKLSKGIFVNTKNKIIYNNKLERNIAFLKWINKHRAINKGKRRYTVSQREIYYALLGDNIGSEQNGRRPVIILQNNKGNAKGNTTVIAPVTTHQKRIKWDTSKRKYFIEIDENNRIRKKYLDFYEIPLRLQGKGDKLYGFVNVMHIREIDRKRIDSHCVGIATNKCFQNILNAINKNLSLS